MVSNEKGAKASTKKVSLPEKVLKDTISALNIFLIIGIFPAMLHYCGAGWHWAVWAVFIPSWYIISLSVSCALTTHIVVTEFKCIAVRRIFPDESSLERLSLEVQLDIKKMTEKLLVVQCIIIVIGWIICPVLN